MKPLQISDNSSKEFSNGGWLSGLKEVGETHRKLVDVIFDCPHHGKCFCDAIGGTTKRNIRAHYHNLQYHYGSVLLCADLPSFERGKRSLQLPRFCRLRGERCAVCQSGGDYSIYHLMTISLSTTKRNPSGVNTSICPTWKTQLLESKLRKLPRTSGVLITTYSNLDKGGNSKDVISVVSNYQGGVTDT